MNADTADEFTLSGQQAAKLLGVSRETVRHYVEAGRLAHRTEIKGLRRYYYVRPADVARLKQELTPDGGSPPEVM